MKKYKLIKKEDYEDYAYELIENYNLTDEEKEEVNILISRYGSLLQKLNKNIKNNKFKLIKEEILKKLEEKDV